MPRPQPKQHTSQLLANDMRPARSAVAARRQRPCLERDLRRAPEHALLTGDAKAVDHVLRQPEGHHLRSRQSEALRAPGARAPRSAPSRRVPFRLTAARTIHTITRTVLPHLRPRLALYATPAHAQHSRAAIQVPSALC
jgi:hypothetical protein